MNIDTLTELTTNLASQYQHILGEANRHEGLSSHTLIESIVNYYEDIINCMPGNVYWIDKNCVAVGCNKNVLDMFGFKSLSAYKGLDFEAMGKAGQWTDEATLAFKRDTMEVLATGQPKLNIEEPPIPHCDGRTIYFLSSRVPLFDHQNNVIGVVGISIDITELRNTQAELKKAKEVAEIASLNKSEFIANMSHDIKTPLTGIIGISEILSCRLHNEELDFAQTLLFSSQQLLNFFDHCLDLFKLEHHDTTLEIETFNIKQLLNDIYHLFMPAIKSKGIMFNIYLQNNFSDYFIGSRTSVYRILLNLVANAVKFTHQGHISVTADVSTHRLGNKTTLKLTVADTGIGIPENKQKVIFEKFTRLSPSYKGIYEGSGIGLYVVQKLATTMLGDIQVCSNEGKGSEFTVTLPIVLASHATNPHAAQQNNLSHFNPTTPAPTRRSVSRNILLVEDNPVAQKIQTSLLTTMNCQVETMDSGEKALEIFEPGKFDLIFMDIGLPGVQGDIAAKLIRKMESGSAYRVPIIALTAHTTEDAKQHYVAAGIDEVYDKPLSLEQTKRIIENYFVALTQTSPA